MHILVVHRDYRVKGGEDFFLENVLLPTLTKLKLNHTICRLPPLFSGGSNLLDAFEIFFMVLGLEKCRPSYFKLRGIFNTSRLTSSDKAFTHVLFNNFLPTVSLSAPEMFQQKGCKTYWWAHNARLTCANGLLYNGKGRCHLCLEKGSWWAFKQLCQSTFVQSLLYALTYRFRRVFKLVGPHLNKIICSSRYTSQSSQEAFRLMLQKPSPFEIVYMPILNQRQKANGARLLTLIDGLPRPFFLFLGRLSQEKGADLFMELARKNPERGFVMAGTGPLLETLKQNSPSNLVFVGFVSDPSEKAWLFENAAALIISSRVPENSPLVIFESHPYNTPIVFPSAGGAEEIVKSLNRSGCSIDQFYGQEFSKTESKMTDFQNDFEERIINIFG